MMKSIIYNIKVMVAIVVASFTMASCLDKEPGSAIPVDQAMQTYEDAEQIVTGIYAMLKSSALFSGYLTLLPDIQTDLVYAVDGYTNVYGNFWQWDVRPTNAEIESVYAGLYSVISNCNFYLERIDKIIAAQTDDDRITTLEFYTGEVYTIRALAYSELLKNYCKAYDPATAKDELGVVLRKYYSEPEPAIRASLYDSYEFVLSDLEKAEELLDEDYDAYSSYYITKGVAHALHARVALNMQDWVKGSAIFFYFGKILGQALHIEAKAGQRVAELAHLALVTRSEDERAGSGHGGLLAEQGFSWQKG